MNELKKNDLLDKLELSQKERDFKKRLEENNKINIELMVVVKKILQCFLDNKLQGRADITVYRNMINYIIKTGKVKYDLQEKYKRYSKVIDSLK